MLEISIRENDEFIKLGQAMKKAGLVDSGVDAKMVILDGQVTVNGQTELQRGKKLHDGDVFSYNDSLYGSQYDIECHTGLHRIPLHWKEIHHVFLSDDRAHQCVDRSDSRDCDHL